MKRRSTNRIIPAALCLLMGLTVCCSMPQNAQGGAFSLPSAQAELTVALFPSVPDPGRFEAAVRAAWEELHPDAALHFASWNSYYDEPSENLDVFVFDSLFLPCFADRGYLLPIP